MRVLSIISINVIRQLTPNVIRRFSLQCTGIICEQLKSLLVSCVNCLSPWARQNFPVPLKIELTLFHRYKKSPLSVHCLHASSELLTELSIKPQQRL